MTAQLLTDKVAIGISACLYDCPVRYNGRAFDALSLLGRERADFVWTPVCPECLAGLGVPRMPVHLTGTGQEVLAGHAKVLERRGRDRTDDIVAGCEAALGALERAGVEAFIAKESSPSCGLYKARVGKRRVETSGGSGVFGAMLLERGWFLIPDEGLANSLLWWDWRRRLHAWLWLKRRPAETNRDLFDAWHVVKFVVQETNRPRADAIGRALAALPKRAAAEERAALKAEMLDALRAPSTRSRIRGAMLKAYEHARKSGSLADVDLHGLEPDTLLERGRMQEVVDDLTGLERVSFENDLLFGPSPVLRRDARRVAARQTASADTADAAPRHPRRRRARPRQLRREEPRMDCLDAIMSRRSIRSYTDEPVTDEQLEVVLRAAMAAPSAGNQQSWRFIVVRSEEQRAALAEATPYCRMIAHAPVALVVCGDTRAEKHPGYRVQDCSAAIENALVAIHATGLALCGSACIRSRSASLTYGAYAESLRASCRCRWSWWGHLADAKPPGKRYEPAYVCEERWSE